MEAPRTSPAPSAEECKAAIAKRFRPSPDWSKVWSFGPKDRSLYTYFKAWFDGSPPPASPYPIPERDVDGWAGIGMYLAMHARAISEDGMTMARCDGSCTVLRVDNGKHLARTKNVYEIHGNDGTPVLDHPENKAVLKKYGLSASGGPWPIPDVFLDWSLSPVGSAVTYHLRDRKTDARLAIGRFASKEESVLPSEPLVSQNGRTLVLVGYFRPQSQGMHFEDAVVDLPAAVTLLYLRASELEPKNRAVGERAANACRTLLGT